MSEPTYFVFFKLEKKGANLDHDVLSISACIGVSSTCLIVDEFICFVKPVSGSNETGWEQRCLDELWNKPEILQSKAEILHNIDQHGVPPNEAAALFLSWLNMHAPNIMRNMVLVTDSPCSDAPALSYLLNRAGFAGVEYAIDNTYRYVIDSTSFHRGVGLLLPRVSMWGAEDAARTRLGMPNVTNPYTKVHGKIESVKSVCWEFLQINRAIEAVAK